MFRSFIRLPWHRPIARISVCHQRFNHILNKNVTPNQTFLTIKKPQLYEIINKMSSVVKTVTYDQLNVIAQTENQYLIDVRERDEIRESGGIPGAVNIPLSEIQLALTQLPPETFKKKYNCEKPTHLSYVVFSCRSGKRSDMAAQLATKLGYQDVAHFPGGFLEWENQTKSMQDSGKTAASSN